MKLLDKNIVDDWWAKQTGGVVPTVGFGSDINSEETQRLRDAFANARQGETYILNKTVTPDITLDIIENTPIIQMADMDKLLSLPLFEHTRDPVYVYSFSAPETCAVCFGTKQVTTYSDQVRECFACSDTNKESASENMDESFVLSCVRILRDCFANIGRYIKHGI